MGKFFIHVHRTITDSRISTSSLPLHRFHPPCSQHFTSCRAFLQFHGHHAFIASIFVVTPCIRVEFGWIRQLLWPFAATHIIGWIEKYRGWTSHRKSLMLDFASIIIMGKRAHSPCWIAEGWQSRHDDVNSLRVSSRHHRAQSLCKVVGLTLPWSHARYFFARTYKQKTKQYIYIYIYL